MFCPSCGVALAQHLKYCNHCGAQLASVQDVVKKAEKRLDEYLDGLFWITFLGLGFILGGLVLIHKLQISSGVMIGFMVLSSAAFLVNFWLNFREVLRITRSSKEQRVAEQLEERRTNELHPMNAQAVLQSAPSVTENTTRELQSVAKEPVPRQR